MTEVGWIRARRKKEKEKEMRVSKEGERGEEKLKNRELENGG